MRRLMPRLAAIYMIWVCIITSAQDRGFASAIEWSPDGETIAIASSNGLWFFDSEFNELGYVPIQAKPVGLFVEILGLECKRRSCCDCISIDIGQRITCSDH